MKIYDINGKQNYQIFGKLVLLSFLICISLQLNNFLAKLFQLQTYRKKSFSTHLYNLLGEMKKAKQFGETNGVLQRLHSLQQTSKFQSKENMKFSAPNPEKTDNLFKQQDQTIEVNSPSDSYEQILIQQGIALFLQREYLYLPSRKLLSNQKYLKPIHRSQAILYFSDLQEQYQLKIQTILLAGNILDRFLCVHLIKDASEFYSVIQCCASIAMKIEEIYPPVKKINIQTMSQLIEKNDKNLLFQLAKCEKFIASKLECRFEKLSPYNFLSGLSNTKRINLEVIFYSTKEKFICFYLLELHLHDNHMLGTYPYSLVASAIDMLIFLIRGGTPQKWKDSLKIHSLSEVKKVATYLLKIAISAQSQVSEIYKKYATKKYEFASLKSYFRSTKSL